MTNITFQCMSCEADFEIDVTHLLERPNSLKCPQCNARPPAHRCHALAQALDDLLSAMAAIRSKVHFELSLDTEELPPPYGRAADAGSPLGLDDDDDEDEDVEDEDDEDEDEDDDDDEFEPGDDDEDDDAEEEEEP